MDKITIISEIRNEIDYLKKERKYESNKAHILQLSNTIAELYKALAIIRASYY